jgi:tRNA A58 N-methylase Trm61
VSKPTSEPTSLVAGDEGTTTSYDASTDMFEVAWDNGSKVPVSYDEIVILQDALRSSDDNALLQ